MSCSSTSPFSGNLGKELWDLDESGFLHDWHIGTLSSPWSSGPCQVCRLCREHFSHGLHWGSGCNWYGGLIPHVGCVLGMDQFLTVSIDPCVPVGASAPKNHVIVVQEYGS